MWILHELNRICHVSATVFDFTVALKIHGKRSFFAAAFTTKQLKLQNSRPQMMNFCIKLLMMSPLLKSCVFKFTSNRRMHRSWTPKLFVFVHSIFGLHVTSQKNIIQTKEPFGFLSRSATRDFKSISVCMFSARYRASFRK